MIGVTKPIVVHLLAESTPKNRKGQGIHPVPADILYNHDRRRDEDHLESPPKQTLGEGEGDLLIRPRYPFDP